jgi:hypothetical protein
MCYLSKFMKKTLTNWTDIENGTTYRTIEGLTFKVDFINKNTIAVLSFPSEKPAQLEDKRQFSKKEYTDMKSYAEMNETCKLTAAAKYACTFNGSYIWSVLHDWRC